MRLLYLSSLLLFLGAAAGAQESGIRLGERPAKSTVQTLDGKPVDFSRYVQGKPALIEFWATWCSRCREMEPRLIAAHRKYGSRVRFVGVAVSVNQSPARVRAYAEKHRFRHDVFYDADGSATDAYQVPATSYIVVLNRAGRVVYTGLGGDQDLEAALRKAL